MAHLVKEKQMTILERSEKKIKFTVLPSDGTNNTANIMITEEGKLNGVVFNYGAMNIEDKNNEGVLTFDYTVEEPKDFFNTISAKDKRELEQAVGDILVGIIETYVMDKTNDNRDNDTK